jgi:hypothetical protein
MTYGVVRAFQVIVNTLLCLKRLASAVQLRPWPPCFQGLSQSSLGSASPLSVRIRKTRRRLFLQRDDGKDLRAARFFASPLSVRFGRPHG